MFLSKNSFLALIFGGIFLLGLFSFGSVWAQSLNNEDLNNLKSDLESKIKIQNQELESLNRQMAEVQAKLKNTKDERQTLQKELTRIRSSIDQLNLNIKADEASIKKLNLEIESLNLDISDIQRSMLNKEEGIASLLKKIQKNDRQNFLITFLSEKSLVDVVFAANSISEINNQLLLEIENLNNLNKDLSNKVVIVSNKKSEITLRRQNLEARKFIVEDQEGEKTTLLANTKNKESTYEQELAELRKKQDEIADEIDRIESQLKAKFDSNLLPTERTGFFAWPVLLRSNGGLGTLTQHFGEVSGLYKGKPHNGMDIGAPVGTPVVAAQGGKVIAVDDNDLSKSRKYQYGKYVLIAHDNNFTTLYAHLSRQSVRVGDVVKLGDLIGYSGSTGYSTGPHLHFGLYWGPSVKMQSVPPAAGLVPVGVVIDPEKYL